MRGYFGVGLDSVRFYPRLRHASGVAFPVDTAMLRDLSRMLWRPIAALQLPPHLTPKIHYPERSNDLFHGSAKWPHAAVMPIRRQC